MVGKYFVGRPQATTLDYLILKQWKTYLSTYKNKNKNKKKIMAQYASTNILFASCKFYDYSARESSKNYMNL